MDQLRACNTCNTPLDEAGVCVACKAAERGLKLLLNSAGYASVREMMELLEEQGLTPEIEQLPPRRPEERSRPLWNLYVPESEAQAAQEFMSRDFTKLLDDPSAAAAAQRGLKSVDLDDGGEIECPACAHRFTLAASSPECPECGLSLGAPADAAPDEAERLS